MTTREWMADGTTLFLATLDRLDDEQLARPIALPGWTGKHLVAHVHYNAVALCRLASWAATRVENRMYESAEQRAREIEHGASLSTATLRALVRQSGDELQAAFAALSPQEWRNEVVTAQGRTVPATELPWLRVREVYVHAIDLDAGVRFDDLPGDVLSALLGDIVAKRAKADEGPALAAWLTGRSLTPPALDRWL